ncbi:MAG: hypothetical protein RIT10_1059 [Bacteroidota bacterium]|jgi:hypothetical protein
MKKAIQLTTLRFSFFLTTSITYVSSFGQTGLTAGDPFTSMSQVANVTTAGVYHFSIGGNTFSTEVDANGYMMIAMDFGNGVGALPKTSTLTNSSRGILTPTILTALDYFDEIRITGPTMDCKNKSHILVNRIRNFRNLSRGFDDNTINDDWTGTNAINLTTNSGGAGLNYALDSTIFHCSYSTGGFHWVPAYPHQRETWASGQIGAAQQLKLWVKASCIPSTEVGFGNNTWNVCGYSVLTASEAELGTKATAVYKGYYQNANLSINTSSATNTPYWTQLTNPSTVAGWNGCQMISDNFMFAYKRTNFEPGYYTFTVNYNDDYLKLYVNGVQQYSTAVCCTSKGVVYSGFLCSSSTVEFRVIDAVGGSSLDVIVTKANWPVKAGANTTYIGGTSHSIGVVENPTLANLATNSWTSTNEAVAGTTVPVSVTPTQTTTYTLTSTIGSCSFVDHILITVTDYLPVELLDFSATCSENKTVELNWSTASEHNAAYFLVEKSRDGQNWSPVKTVQAVGNSTQISFYSIDDLISSTVTNYYRLSQVDENGAVKKYDVISSNCVQDNDFSLHIYPNPTNGEFSIQLNNPLSGNYTIELVSITGQLISRKCNTLSTSETTVIKSTELLPAGTYFVRLLKDESLMETTKLMVE